MPPPTNEQTEPQDAQAPAGPTISGAALRQFYLEFADTKMGLHQARATVEERDATIAEQAEAIRAGAARVAELEARVAALADENARLLAAATRPPALAKHREIPPPTAEDRPQGQPPEGE